MLDRLTTRFTVLIERIAAAFAAASALRQATPACRGAPSP
jgi:hypothetical protein